MCIRDRPPAIRRVPYRRKPVLEQYFARALVRQNLALDALQGVVDRLSVAAQLLCHLLVGRALEVEAKRIGFELRETRPEAEDQALQLLGGDDADGGIVDAGPGQSI